MKHAGQLNPSLLTQTLLRQTLLLLLQSKIDSFWKAKPQTTLQDQKKGCGHYFTIYYLSLMGNPTFPVYYTFLQNSHACLQRLLNINLLRSMASIRVSKNNGNNVNVNVYCFTQAQNTACQKTHHGTGSAASQVVYLILEWKKKSVSQSRRKSKCSVVTFCSLLLGKF